MPIESEIDHERRLVVARDDCAFALGRMYETYRGLDPRSTKEVRVFRTVPEALSYLRPART